MAWSCNVCVSCFLIRTVLRQLWLYCGLKGTQHSPEPVHNHFVWNYLSHSRWKRLLDMQDTIYCCVEWRALHVFKSCILAMSLVSLGFLNKQPLQSFCLGPYTEKASLCFNNSCHLRVKDFPHSGILQLVVHMWNTCWLNISRLW